MFVAREPFELVSLLFDDEPTRSIRFEEDNNALGRSRESDLIFLIFVAIMLESNLHA
jgi:hypothetical protein